MYCLNEGNKEFQVSLNSDIYIDKTGLIEYTNEMISTQQRFICVSHPRRFGKTMAAKMLEAYYCRTCDSHSQFDGLAVSKTEKYEAHINRYDVVFITMTSVLYEAKDIKSALAKLAAEIIDDLKTAYPDVDYDGDNVFGILKAVYSKTGSRFVFIIDEWDRPFRERKDDTDGHIDYFVFLRRLLKDQGYVALAYMTGIFPVSCFHSEIDLNMFSEFSMRWPGALKKYFGFTEDEVRALCDEKRFSYDDLDDFYNGYFFEDGQGKGLRIFNPWSVTDAFDRGRTLISWPNTIGREYLPSLIKKDVDGLHSLLLRLLNDEKNIYVPKPFGGDVTALRTGNDIITWLMHTGYLTLDLETGLRIPNHEIRVGFNDAVGRIKDCPLSRYMRDSEMLWSAAEIDGDTEKVCELLKKIHRYYVSVRHRGEGTLFDFVRFAFVFARSNYRFGPESRAGNEPGILTLTPYNPSWNAPILIELGNDTDSADRTRFSESFRERGYKGKVLFMKISGKKSGTMPRAHGRFACKIEIEGPL